MNPFWHWWQHLPEKMDPVIFQIGGFKLQYYGMMYIVAFATTYLLVRYRMRTEPRFKDISTEQVQGLFTAIIIGLILGARLGYVVFYNLPYYLTHPLEIFLPFDTNSGWRFTGITGMSYHGGFIGTFIAHVWFVHKNSLSFKDTTDILVPCVPLGYTFGRLGNFINGELYGRSTDAVFGMYFPEAPGNSLRHPSQLYEAALEGIFLFSVMWFFRKRIKTKGSMIGIYMIGYGLVRFMIEFVRQPDAHLGLIASSYSMGQILCAVMVVVGSGLYLYSRMTDETVLASDSRNSLPYKKVKKNKKKKK
jgi:phosphatidylglycerol:prolipoprotein diacylglycerol transferase